METMNKQVRTPLPNLMSCLVVLLLAALLEPAAGSGASGAPAGTASGFEWQKQPDSLALLHNDRVVWKFNYGSSAAKPFFHPVALPDGPVLTLDRPSDHPWHHALWFSWKFINGVNYWEEDRATGNAAGFTEWSRPRVETRRDFSARIALNLLYCPAVGKPVLGEKRVIEISRPDEHGAYQFDWTMAFTPVERDVLLDRTPPPGQPGGEPWGGYAGLSVRFAKEVKDPRILTTEGLAVFADGRYRAKAMGLDYSGWFADREAGLAILDWPGNFNSPTPWYAIADATMNYFSPAVIQRQPCALKAGHTLNLRYRVIVHPGRWSAEQVRQASEQFVLHKKS